MEQLAGIRHYPGQLAGLRVAVLLPPADIQAAQAVSCFASLCPEMGGVALVLAGCSHPLEIGNLLRGSVAES